MYTGVPSLARCGTKSVSELYASVPTIVPSCVYIGCAQIDGAIERIFTGKKELQEYEKIIDTMIEIIVDMNFNSSIIRQ